MPTSCVCLTVFSESSGINKKGAVIAAFLESAWCLQRVLSPQVSLTTIRMGKTQQVQYCPFGFPKIYGGNTLSFEWMALNTMFVVVVVVPVVIVVAAVVVVLVLFVLLLLLICS